MGYIYIMLCITLFESVTGGWWVIIYIMLCKKLCESVTEERWVIYIYYVLYNTM